MAFTEISDIKAAVSAFQNNTVFMELRRRWEQDFDLYRLQPYDAGKGYISYTSNSPRVYIEKLLSIQNSAELLIRIPEDVLTDDQARVASNVERFLYGCINLNDEKSLTMPNVPAIRAQMAWHGHLRGGFGILTYIHKSGEKETFPQISIWDLYNTSYGVGENGLDWATYSYKMDRKAAEKFFGMEITSMASVGLGQNEVDIIDYWDTEKYGVIAGGVWVRKPTKHNLGYCPVAIMTVGSTPIVWQANYQYTSIHVGESSLASNRGLYPLLNKTLSDLLTIVRRGVKVPMIEWTADGKPRIEQDIFQVDKAAVITMVANSGEKIEPAIPPSMPPDTSPLINWVTGEVQRGSLPHTAYGELGFRLSGYALQTLRADMDTATRQVGETIARAFTIASLWLLKQYAAGGFPPVMVRGRTSRNEVFGYPVAQSIKPEDIAGDWHPEIKVEPKLPKDDSQNAMLAQTYRQGESPLLSDETIRSEVLGIRDPDLERGKISKEWADRQIIERLYDAYVMYLEDMNPDKAQNILAELRRVMMETGVAPSPRLAKKMTPTQGEAMGTRGAGIPARNTGVPASVMPAESLGGMPPGALNATAPAPAEEEV